MKRRKPVAAIDVGSTKVSVIVGDLGDRGEMRVLGFGVAPASGLSRGVIDNIQSARDAVATAVAKAEQSCGMRILSAVVGISGGHIEAQNNRGIVTIPDRSRPISVEDRARVLDIAGEISIPTNRQVLHVLPRGYWVEGTELVSDPVGMYGNRLDAETHIISGSVSAIQNLTKCVEGAGVQVDEITLEPLASATAVLAEQERQQGVAVVDIGGSTTSIVVFDEGAVAHTASLPIAGSHFTHDLARMLRCPWESAEAAKCEYGSALGGGDSSDCVEIQAFGTQAVKQVSLTHVCDILQARAEEVLDMVAMELRKVRLFERVAAGLVLTGGGSQLRGIAEVAEHHLRLPARVGRPKGFSGMSDLIGTPAFATSIGLVEYALRDDDAYYESTANGFDVTAGGLFKRLASMGRALMPQ
jgi:cell division protein FtsA